VVHSVVQLVVVTMFVVSQICMMLLLDFYVPDDCKDFCSYTVGRVCMASGL
jgi:hypothetical protein